MTLATTFASTRSTRSSGLAAVALCALSLVVAVAAPALAGPGVDFAANHICPGVAGANSYSGVDCIALSNSGGFVEIFATFKAAEPIPDLSNLDGRVDVYVYGTWATTGQFWDTSAGACLDNNGAAPAANTFIGSKPSANCGNVATIRPAFGASAQTTVIESPNELNMFFTVYNSAPISITTAQRIFGFQIRYDPIYATENGLFTCGTCSTPAMWYLNHAQPGSLSALPTTDLATSTGEVPGCGSAAQIGFLGTPARSEDVGTTEVAVPVNRANERGRCPKTPAS